MLSPTRIFFQGHCKVLKTMFSRALVADYFTSFMPWNRFLRILPKEIELEMCTLREESVCGRNFCGSALLQNFFILWEKTFAVLRN